MRTRDPRQRCRLKCLGPHRNVTDSVAVRLHAEGPHPRRLGCESGAGGLSNKEGSGCRWWRSHRCPTAGLNVAQSLFWNSTTSEVTSGAKEMITSRRLVALQFGLLIATIQEFPMWCQKLQFWDLKYSVSESLCSTEAASPMSTAKSFTCRCPPAQETRVNCRKELCRVSQTAARLTLNRLAIPVPTSSV